MARRDPVRAIRATSWLALASMAALAGCFPYLTPPAPLLQFQEAGDVFVSAGASGVWTHLPVPDAYGATAGFALNDDIALVGSGHMAQDARQLGGEVAVLGYRSQQISRKARRFSTFGGQVGFGGLNRVTTDDPALADYQANVTHTEMSGWVGSIGGQYAYGTDWKWVAVGTTWRGNFVYIDYSRYRYGGVETSRSQEMAVIFDSSFHVEFGPPVIRAGLMFGANAPIPFGIPPEGPVFAPMSAQTYLGLTASSRF